MKQLLIIDAHSFVDVITNSSTELFVCDINKTAEAVKEILDANPDLSGYECPWVFSIDEYREWKKVNKANERWIDDNKYRYIEGWFYDEENEDDLEYLRKRFIEDGDSSGSMWSSSRNIFSDRIQNAKRQDDKFEHLYKHDYEARKLEMEKIYQEHLAMTEKPDWWVHPLKYYHNDQPISDLDGKIIIVGSSDNSIHYETMEWIEKTFNAQRHHLG